MIAISSIAGLRGLRNAIAYTASKHAVIGLIRGLSEEYMGGPVTFNAICPGYVDTPIVDRNAVEIAELKGITDAEARAYLARGNRHKRLLEADEVDGHGSLDLLGRRAQRERAGDPDRRGTGGMRVGDQGQCLRRFPVRWRSASVHLRSGSAYLWKDEGGARDILETSA